MLVTQPGEQSAFELAVPVSSAIWCHLVFGKVTWTAQTPWLPDSPRLVPGQFQGA